MSVKVFGRKCEICRRSTFDQRTLGPLVHTKTISGHFNCVLYSPVAPDATSLAPHPEDDSIAGVTTRFVREEGKRAKKLVIDFSKFFNWFYFFSLLMYVSILLFLRCAIIAKLSAHTLAVVKTLATIQWSNFAQKNSMLIVDSRQEHHSTSARAEALFRFVLNIGIQLKGR